MKKILTVLASGLAMFTTSCDQQNEKKIIEHPKPSNSEITVETVNSDLALGFQKLEMVCFSCHSPNANIAEKVAPTMAEVKSVYLNKFGSQDDFVAQFKAFVGNPNSDISILDHATELYGVMPKFQFSDKELTQIANYVYQSDLEKEGWFENTFQSEKVKYKADDSKLSYAELGKKFALSTKSILGKNLKGAIKNKGTEHAVSFCNERAYFLTDSMAVQLHAGIKRVSDQPRNLLNQANEAELKYISESKIALANGEKLKPSVQEINGKMVGYYPITTNKMCLQCHGIPTKQIKLETLAQLQTLYPNDAATGYDVNQLRGIWVVEMDKK